MSWLGFFVFHVDYIKVLINMLVYMMCYSVHARFAGSGVVV